MGNYQYKYLNKINSPVDLKKYSEEDLEEISRELREFIIEELSCNPGHFGASLGVVELTVALHYVFSAPEDKIVWDVGHQAYGHKILTGRRDVFHTNRKYGGISGFPKMTESEYDAFGVGHSSTSISAALGIAVANHQHQHKKNQVIAVIGDGSMTGGMAFEGLNNAGIEKTNLLVILNDNNISIDPGVGALREYLTDVVTSRTYNKLKKDVWDMLGHFKRMGPNARAYIQKVEHAVKTMLLRQSNLFEGFNFRYFGPVDGHDVQYLTKILQDLKDIEGPKLLHILTVKGKGFIQAEKNQTQYHAPGKFDKKTGEILEAGSAKVEPPRFQDVFGQTLTELAKKNKSIIGITPAMPSGCSLNIMMQEMPDRSYDVGIAEQHAVTFSAGLASQGMVPFCNIYSSFMQRAYDQVIHDVALQNLNVVFCLDRGGLVGSDGPTHHGVFDLAYFRCIPNMIISAPMDEVELRNLMYTSQLKNKGPFVIRYPRGNGSLVEWKKPFEEIPIGKSRKLREGNDLALLTIGTAGSLAKEALEALAEEHYDVAHYDMRFVKPLDFDTLHEIFKKFKNVITVEDGSIMGGFGSAILEFMADNGYFAKLSRLGIPDRFIEQGTQAELYQDCGYDAQSIYRVVKTMIKPRVLSHAV